MILIAPDKFKGTMTAREAAEIIAAQLSSSYDVFIAPMADGGEGTAEIVAAASGWRDRGGWYYSAETGEAIVDSSAYIGQKYAAHTAGDIMTRTSRPLADAVNHIFEAVSPRLLYISVGGTSICDGGRGFIEGIEDRVDASRLVGLCDVAVPLVAPIGQPSALMFAPQKGATPEQLPILADRLLEVQQRYGGASPWDGAGGGMGYALASALGASCRSGAEFVLSRYQIPWSEISLIITGEGSLDDQTSQGKVASALAEAARQHHNLNSHFNPDFTPNSHSNTNPNVHLAPGEIPIIAVAGVVRGVHPEFTRVISTTDFLPDLPLTPAVARRRLALAINGLEMK
jgi:glycerate kinase